MQTLPDFAGAVRKVEHAGLHIASFEREAERHFSKRPYDVVQTPHVDTLQPGYYLSERRAFPDQRFALLLGDVLHNLRSALDHLAHACAVANGEAGKHSQFPILLKETGLEAKLTKDLTTAGPMAIEIVRSFAPTPSGNPILAALHELNIMDKHRLILPVACTMNVSVKVGGFERMPVVTARGVASPEPGGSCFIPAPPGYEMGIAHDFSFTGDIVFPAGSILAGQPCIECLLEMSAVVIDVISAFETGFGTQRLTAGIPMQRCRPSAS